MTRLFLFGTNLSPDFTLGDFFRFARRATFVASMNSRLWALASVLRRVEARELRRRSHNGVFTFLALGFRRLGDGPSGMAAAAA